MPYAGESVSMIGHLGNALPYLSQIVLILKETVMQLAPVMSLLVMLLHRSQSVAAKHAGLTNIDPGIPEMLN